MPSNIETFNKGDLVRLPPSEIDRKLWVGASRDGWLVVEGCRNGHKHALWRYCSPDGATTPLHLSTCAS